MALNPLNSSNLEQLALKGLIFGNAAVYAPLLSAQYIHYQHPIALSSRKIVYVILCV